MFCSSCGNELAEGAAFCSACGAKVGGAASSASAASAPVAEPEGNPLQELVEGLTTEQYSISRSEGMYVISWKDAEHPNDLAIGEFDMDGTALVEELDIAATPRVLSDVYEAVVAAAQSEAGRLIWNN